LSSNFRPGVDEVPPDVEYFGVQAETKTQRPKTMHMAVVGRSKKIGLFKLPTGKGKGNGTNSKTLIPIWKDIKVAARRVGIKDPFLLLDKASVHTSKLSKRNLDEIYGKGNWALQSPKSPDCKNCDVGLFGNASRWMSKKAASSTAEVDKEVKAWWATVEGPMLTAIDDRVLRNYDKILELKGGNFYDESTI